MFLVITIFFSISAYKDAHSYFYHELSPGLVLVYYFDELIIMNLYML